MAEGPIGTTSSPLYTKIFTGFRAALDLSQVSLAVGGIFATWIGWFILSWLFHTNSIPQWRDYQDRHENKALAWKFFKTDRARWNLLHRLAGPGTNDPKQAVAVDAADVAPDLETFIDLRAVAESRKQVTVKDGELHFDGNTFSAKPVQEIDADRFAKVKPVALADVRIVDEAKQEVEIGGVVIKIDSNFATFKSLRETAKPIDTIPEKTRDLFARTLERPALKQAAKFRTSPWHEDRGPNQYLLVSGAIKGSGLPAARGGLIEWVLRDLAPVLFEPIIKLLAPIYYLLTPEAWSVRNFFYLFFILIWNVMVWGFFGGAITRLAAMQIARNETESVWTAIAFARQRCVHYIMAPMAPLLALALLTLVLVAFGLVQGWTFWFGDVIIAGFLWPIVIVIGLLMVALLVGLFGWPLMYPTISVEGSDLFDALSRSFGYVYQKPWRLAGYTLIAAAYGAVVVFFIGFMGSLLVYLGQWGVGRAPFLASEDPARDRTPVYLFMHAPTSYGWRDLMFHDSPWAVKAVNSAGVGVAPVLYELDPKYLESVSAFNRIGGWMVSAWTSLVFLIVLGFSYSYFWTASTIIYFLMRKQVDDTEFDEIYLDEDEAPPPAPISPPPPPAPAAKPNTLSLNVVEAPPKSESPPT